MYIYQAKVTCRWKVAKRVTTIDKQLSHGRQSQRFEKPAWCSLIDSKIDPNRQKIQILGVVS